MPKVIKKLLKNESGEEVEYTNYFIVLYSFIILGLVVFIFQLATANINFYNKNNIAVTAEVPETIGYSIIETHGNKGILVKGNYPNGFVVLDKNNNIIFESHNIIPDEGRLVKIGDEIDSIIIVPVI